MKQYRIMTTQSSAVLGRYDFEALELKLNEAAGDGWQVVSSYQAGNLLKSTNAHLVVILERDAI